MPWGQYYLNQLVLNQGIWYVDTMSIFVRHCRYIRFITLMIPLFLVLVGMRSPDLFRPHKPKPMRRAVLDKTPVRTVLQSVEKIDIDPVIASPPAIVFLATVEPFPEATTIYSLLPLLSLNPLPPRAPPASNPLA